MFETFWHSFFLKEVSGTEIQRKTNLGILMAMRGIIS